MIKVCADIGRWQPIFVGVAILMDKCVRSSVLNMFHMSSREANGSQLTAD